MMRGHIFEDTDEKDANDSGSDMCWDGMLMMVERLGMMLLIKCDIQDGTGYGDFIDTKRVLTMKQVKEVIHMRIIMRGGFLRGCKHGGRYLR